MHNDPAWNLQVVIVFGGGIIGVALFLWEAYIKAYINSDQHERVPKQRKSADEPRRF
jgi:hypothetical protein